MRTRNRLLVLALTAVTGVAFAAGSASSQSDAAQRRWVPTVHCEAPRTLHLQRFEDGSARLICNGRVLARVAVPW